MDQLRRDISIGLRRLWKDRSFSATVFLTLTLCLGANVALFSLVNRVLLQPLPFPDAARIVNVGNSYPKAGAANLRAVAVPDYFDRLRDIRAFESQALFGGSSSSLDQNGTPTRVPGLNVTPSFFRVLGVAPIVGRTFTDEEGEPGANQKVVLSYGLWQSAFGGDPGIAGREIRLDGQPLTVVGVMPQDFIFQRPEVMLWRALAFTPQQRSDQTRHSNNFQQLARLAPGATVAQAQAQVDALNAANLDRFPQFKDLVVNAGFHTVVVSMQDDLVRDVKGTLYLLWGGALFVLLIGGVNVTNLTLVRARGRLKELATRMALGASRADLARQLVIENFLLALGAAIASLGVGWGAIRLMSVLNLQQLPRGHEIGLDLLASIAAVTAGGLIGIVLGLIPVAAVTPTVLTTMLRDEGRTGTSGRGARAIRRGLVVAQVAVAFVLLAGAGLFFASFQRILAIDPGFRAEGVSTASVVLPRTRYKDNAAMASFLDESIRQLRALPGVAAVGVTNNLPVSGNMNNSVIFAEGYQMRPGESAIAPTNVLVSPGYFEAMGVRLVSGRVFDDRDVPRSSDAQTAFGTSQPRVVIVDERLARRFWGDQNPIGRRLFLPTDPNNMTAITERTVFIDVVGVIQEMKLQSLTQEDQFVGACFFPIAQLLPPPQAPGVFFNYAIKAAGRPGQGAPAMPGTLETMSAPIRSVFSSLDRELPVFDMQPMSDRVSRSLVSRRSPLFIASAFAAIALFLSAIGIYGVLAYGVTQRTREIGIRMALGSHRRQVFGLILREGLVLVAGGFALGIAGALALRTSLQSQLFGITATDPLVLGAMAVVLGLVALAACALPARRATRIDPVIALADS